VRSTPIRPVACDDSNFLHSSAKLTTAWWSFSLRFRTILISDKRSAVDKKVFPGCRFAPTVLASIEPVCPALPKPPAKKHATSDPVLQSSRPCAYTPLSASLCSPSTLACRPSSCQPVRSGPLPLFAVTHRFLASALAVSHLLFPFRFSWCRSV